ncbi:MAG TPA: hypothetical protein VG992_02950 [Candidatus Saccharimonadales bacterium]|nr:hypothetical protein [Candidatus Saccharimonadales bacterium]
MNILPLLSGYTSNSYNAGRATAFVMLLSFVVTFIFTRVYTRLARIRGWRSTSINGVHTHHLVFGLVIAFFAAALEFALLPKAGWLKLTLAGLFGGGAALVLDEFALAVHLEDVYWEKEGRKSVDAVIIGAIFGLLFLLHTAPFGRSADLPRMLLTIAQLINMAFVLTAALKGKLYLASFGVFVPLLAIVGAIRLAEPGSIWTRLIYKTNDKHLRAVARYSRYERTWRPRKEFLLDIVGGKTGRPRQRPGQSR